MRRSIVWRCAVAVALAQIGHAVILAAIFIATGAGPMFNSWIDHAMQTLRGHHELLLEIADTQGPDAARRAAATLSMSGFRHRIVPAADFGRQGSHLELTGEDWHELAEFAEGPSFRDGELRWITFPAHAADGTIGDDQVVVLGSAAWPIERVIRPLAAWIGSSLLLSAIAGGLVATWFTHPITRLRKSVARFAAGDLDARPDPRLESRGDEIGGLVAELSRMEDRIAALVGAQRELLDDVAHELRSPLARLNIAIELAERAKEDRTGGPGPGGSAAMFDRIRQECAQLAGMVSRLLELSALEHRLDDDKRVEVSLTRTVQDVVEDCDFEAQASGRRVHLDADPDVRVFGNEDMLRTAVENVVRNAIRYTPVGRSVDIGLRTAGPRKERAVISIRDHGPGVTEDALPKLFQPFYRVESDRSKHSGGAGLGLALADRAVRVHAGTIVARNHEHGGLEFVIDLPALWPGG